MSRLRDFGMNINRISVLMFNLDMNMSCKRKGMKMHNSHYTKRPPSCLHFLNKNILYYFHIITEEPSQHVWLDLAFASKNLKFSGQMSDDGANLPACMVPENIMKSCLDVHLS